MNARDRIAVILKHTGFDGEEVEIMLDDFAHELAEEMILAISNPANRAGLGWESAVEVIRSIYDIREDGK